MDTPITRPKPSKARQDSLENVPNDVQEAIILEELLFVLMVGSLDLFVLCLTVLQGIPGTYITYDPAYSPEDEENLRGVHFSIAPSLGQS